MNNSNMVGQSTDLAGKRIQQYFWYKQMGLDWVNFMIPIL